MDVLITHLSLFIQISVSGKDHWKFFVSTVPAIVAHRDHCNKKKAESDSYRGRESKNLLSVGYTFI